MRTAQLKTNKIMNIALQIASNLSVVSEPFMPFTAHKLADMLGLNELSWKHAGSDALLEVDSKIESAQLLFRKIEDSEIEAQLKKLETSKVENQMVNPQKENVSFEAFCSMDIRVGTIIAAEKVKKTKKLLRLTVNTGIDIRTVISGIAEYYQPEDILGRQVSVLVNLAPRNIKGIESQGMILMAEDKDGTLQFVGPSEVSSNGSIIA